MEEESYSCAICFDVKTSVPCYGCCDDISEDDIDYISIPIDNPSHSYYGQLDIETPEVGVVYSMLDVHIEKMVCKYGNRFNIDLKASLKDFKDSIQDSYTALRQSNSINKIEIEETKKKIEEQSILIAELIKNSSTFVVKEISQEEEIEMEEVRKSLEKKGLIEKKTKRKRRSGI